ncbi:MAG: hypothetical protein KDD19_17055 [Phaeodactylibacter sp.]|nr:hypothetical protein [Phaeodactylibacter sp.]MCB9050979.1 hypothetical protein [Lewinellaceae bacterium]
MEKKMNPIDQIIKEKLGGLQVPFDAGSWQLMEQKLDEEAMGMGEEGQPVADTKHIDEAIFDKLHRYSADYQPNHWHRMEALLEEAFAWPRQVLRYKLTELALMLLIFLFLWQYIPSDNSLAPLPPHAIERATPDTPVLRKPAPALKGKADTAPQAGLQSEIPGLDSKAPAPAVAEVPAPAVATGKGGARSTTGSRAVATRQPQQPAQGLSIADASPDTDETLSRSAFSLAPLSQRTSFLASPAYSLPLEVVTASASLAALDELRTLTAEVVYDNLRDIGAVSFARNRNRLALRVGMFGSAEYNHITVPSSEEKKLEEELQRYAMGYGGGLSLGVEYGRFEVETGAIYAARQYPVGLVYVNGSVGGGLQGQRLQASELNIINVPLHFRYTFLRRNSWRAYALAGASIQVAFQRNYYVTEEPQFDFLPMQPPPAPPPTSGEEAAIDRIRKSGLGWFEGGTFEENAYLTGNVGIGLEHYINSRWSLFVQPTYQHSLQYFRVGLGPNADRINSLSVLFGAKVRMK